MKGLVDLAKDEFKDLQFIINSNSSLASSVWKSKLSTGKALEVLSLLALLREISELKLNCAIPKLFQNQPELFYLRNEIPYHHSAQAGHEASTEGEFLLKERFLAAILPRATFEIGSEKYMVYREGNPLHLISKLLKGEPIYKERPDLIIVKGELLVEKYCDSSLSFLHVLANGAKLKVELSIKNTNLIPIKSFSMSPEYLTHTSGIIECSVSKSKKHVDEQLDRYLSLFSNEAQHTTCFFIHGGKDEATNFSTAKVDLNNLVSSFSSDVVRAKLRDFIHYQ